MSTDNPASGTRDYSDDERALMARLAKDMVPADPNRPELHWRDIGAAPPSPVSEPHPDHVVEPADESGAPHLDSHGGACLCDCLDCTHGRFCICPDCKAPATSEHRHLASPDEDASAFPDVAARLRAAVRAETPRPTDVDAIKADERARIVVALRARVEAGKASLESFAWLRGIEAAADLIERGDL